MNIQHVARPWFDHSSLLDPNPMRLETGIQRLEEGMLMVAVRTDMPGCKGRMLDWWFRFFETTQHIKWWHPVDHIEHRGWDANWQRGKNYYGASVQAVEALAHIPPVLAKLKFHDPRAVFGAEPVEEALNQKRVSAIIAARIGFGEHTELDLNNDPLDGQMLHVARDTPFGCVLRSRFVLGMNSEDAAREPDDDLGLALLRHCYNEFTFLSRLLPSLYFGEKADGEEVPLPW